MNKYSKKRRKYYFFLVLLLNDLFFLSISFLVAFIARFGFNLRDNIEPFVSYYLLYSVFGIAIIMILLAFNKLYSLDNIRPGMDTNTKILLNTILGIFTISTLNFYINRDGYLLSRAWLIYVGLFSFVFLVVGRVLARRIVNIVFTRLGIKRNVLIVGLNEESRRIAATFGKVELDNVNVVGFIDHRKKLRVSAAEEFKDLKVLGALDDVKDCIAKYDIDTIVISSPDLKYDEMQEFLESIKGFNLEMAAFIAFFTRLLSTE